MFTWTIQPKPQIHYMDGFGTHTTQPSEAQGKGLGLLWDPPDLVSATGRTLAWRNRGGITRDL